MMMRPGDIPGRIFLCCHRNQSSDHRDLSTEHTEDTDFLSTEDTFFLVATLEILEEIFNKIWPEARNNLPLCLHKQNL